MFISLGQIFFIRLSLVTNKYKQQTNTKKRKLIT